jgi:UMF1 family MFS transporter
VSARPRREVVAWCLFDFANSSYTTLIITVAYSVFFREVVVHAADNSGDRLWGFANFLASGITAVLSPILGAAADHSGRKKAFLVLLTLQTVVFTAMLATVGPGAIAWGMFLYVVATVGFEAGYVFYNAFLPDVATSDNVGRISGWAWAVGYAGGLLSLVLCYPLLKRPLLDAARAIDPAAVQGRQLAFVVVAAFFLVFALPAFLWLRESQPLGERPHGVAGYARVGFRRVRQTLTHLRDYRDVARFILASLFFTDGITTVISFSAIYATVTFGFSPGDLVILFLVLNVVAFPGAALAGHVADRIGAKRTILVSLVLWIAVVLVGAAATSRGQFWVMAAGAAIGMGSTQAVGRSFMAQITPPDRESEFFGFYVLAGKFASMFGPLLFGVVSHATGSQKWAVLSLLPFFLLGFAIMLRIDEARAIAAAGQPGA